MSIISRHIDKYNERYAKYGDNHLALGWPNEEDNHKRFEVMLDIVSKERYGSAPLLDFGCGLGHFYEWMTTCHADVLRWDIEYVGLDINPNFIAMCHKKYPHVDFICHDILSDDTALEQFDYIICNGVFTEKLDTPQMEQFEYFGTIVKRLWEHTRYGLAFNVMSDYVDWKRDDLFHVPFDMMAAFVNGELSRNFTFRHDYGLWEYTTYVYR